MTDDVLSLEFRILLRYKMLHTTYMLSLSGTRNLLRYLIMPPHYCLHFRGYRPRLIVSDFLPSLTINNARLFGPHICVICRDQHSPSPTRLTLSLPHHKRRSGFGLHGLPLTRRVVVNLPFKHPCECLSAMPVIFS